MADRSPAGPRRVWGTLRFRITMVSTLAIGVILIAAGVALVEVQRHQLTPQPDEALRDRAEDIASGLIESPPPRTLPGSGSEDVVAQVVSADGTVLSSTVNIQGEPPIGDPPSVGQDEVLRTVKHLRSDDDSSRVLAQRVTTPNGPVVVYVALTFDEIRRSTRSLVTSLAVTIPILLAVLAALIWWLVGRTLRPMEAIRAEVAEISATDLQRRVPEPPGDDEVARLARTMNEMLDRVETATGRQQRFVADASHELRSPLTRMRGELEVDLAHPESADLATTHRSVLEETTNLQRLVDDLLQLARSDSHTSLDRWEPVDLDDILLDDARRLRAASAGRVDVSGVSAAQVHGDPIQLARAIRNLTDNALRHASSIVTLTLAERDDVAVLTVADDGPGIPADQRERVFERFARLNDARSSHNGGTGLGLAIARDLIEHHRGTVVVDDGFHGGTRFTVTLPL